MIEYEYESLVNSIVPETAEEGINMDTANLIHDEDVKKMRALVKEAKACKKANDIKKSISNLNQAIVLANKMKQKIDAAPEPKNWGQRILSWFTPIFTLMPSKEISKIYPRLYLTGNNDAPIGIEIVVETKTYTDQLSMNTRSSVKETLQYKMNLFIHQCEMYMKAYKQAEQMAKTVDAKKLPRKNEVAKESCIPVNTVYSIVAE